MEQSNHHKTVIVVAGPTAIGKTKVAIQLAQHFHTEIISSDSRQCYKEMSIGTAVPSTEELETIPHHFIHSHSIHQEMNVGEYEQYAIDTVTALFKKKDIVILCGGTGLYIKAFCEGIDNMPAIDTKLKEEILKEYQEKGLPWLQQELEKKDALGYAHLEQDNPQRLMRALAVKRQTGQSIKDFQTGIKKERPFDIIKIGLSIEKELLWENIKNRIDEMAKAGLEEEAKKLYPYRHLNALQTTGYQEIFDFMDNKCSFEEALEQIYIHTRQYAKRQKTWLRKDKDIEWFSPLDVSYIIDYLEEKLNFA